MSCYVLMGVSGCGKTSVGEALAQRGVLTFIDGDALHPEANIQKMARGIPLEDEDRKPWLIEVGITLASSRDVTAIGCSALKKMYRDIIRYEAGQPVTFLHLHADKTVLAKRVANRPGHFMPASLLDSQFETLEMLGPDEDGAIIDIAKPVEQVIAACEGRIRGET